MKNFQLLSLVLFPMIMIGTTIGQCPISFSPCECYYDPSMTGPEVTCDDVPSIIVKQIFNKIKSNYYIGEFVLIPYTDDRTVIANVIGNRTTIGSLTLSCQARSYLLNIDPAAFSSTKAVTKSLKIVGCDLNKLNWGFLSGFSNLSSLDVLFSSNLHSTFSTLPSASLIKLSNIYLRSIIGLDGFRNNSLKFPPPPPKGLSSLFIGFCYNFGSVALENLLGKWINPTSKNTLNSIAVVANNLTQIPASVSKLTKLVNIEFWENMQPLKLVKGAFNFTAPVRALYMDYSEIATIPVGTYSGDFSDGLVSFYNNKLTTFDSAVFRPILQQIFNGAGYLEVNTNPFDCSVRNQCGLAWLIRDNPQYLNSMWSAQCSNGTFFFQLNAMALRTPTGSRCP